MLGLGALAVALVASVIWFQVRDLPLPNIDDLQASPGVRRTVARYTDEVRRNPRSATAWGQLGAVLYAYRLGPAAVVALTRAERLDPRNPRWPYLQALLVLFDDPPKAEERLRRTIELCGSDPATPRLRLARLLAEQGRWAEARQPLDELLKLRPEPPHALLLAARAAQERGEPDQALALARKAAESPLTAKPALSLLSNLLTRRGELQAAAEALRQAGGAPGGDLLIDPFETEAKALREDPNALSERVHPLMARGRLSEAEPLIERLQQDHPDYPDTWLAAGRLALLRKNPSLAERHLRRHLQLDGASIQGWFQLGLALMNQQRDAEAGEAFGKAVQAKPDFGPAWFNRGVVLGRNSRRPEALAAFREAIRHSPEHIESYLLAADLELQAGRPESAEAFLQQAERLSPGDRRIAGMRRRISATPAVP